MSISRWFAKLYKNLGNVGVQPAPVSLGRWVVTTIPMHLALGQDYILTDGSLSNVQAADTLVVGLAITTEAQVGWWLFETSLMATPTLQRLRLLKGLPVLGSLLTVGSRIDYDMQFLLGQTGSPLSEVYREPFPLYCALGTSWEVRITAAMVMGDNVRATVHAWKVYVE